MSFESCIDIDVMPEKKVLQELTIQACMEIDILPKEETLTATLGL